MISVLKSKPKLIFIVGVIVFCATILILGKIARSKTFQSFNIYNIEYVRKSGSNPTVVKEIKHPCELSSLDISFNFSTSEPTFSYGNLFQTGDSSSAIRMELQPPNNLVFILNNETVLPLLKSVEIEKEYNIRLSYKRNQFIKVFVDKRGVLNNQNLAFLSEAIDISNIVVGTGLSRQRDLIGSVKDFNINCIYTYYGIAAIVARWAIFFLCGIFFLMSFSLNSISGVLCKDKVPLQIPSDFFCIALFAFSLICISLGLFFLNLAGPECQGLSKWIPHIMLPISILVGFYFCKHAGAVWIWTVWPLLTVFLTYTLLLVFSIGFKEPFLIALFLFCNYSFLHLLYRTKARLIQSHDRKNGHNIWTALGIYFVFSAISWIAIVDLGNWHDFRLSIDNYFEITVVGSFLILRLIFGMLFEKNFFFKFDIQSISTIGKKKYITLLSFVDIAAIAIFFLFSFRHDSLFIPGSEYHWAYYTAIIKGLRAGGWLLWDTPSQYGFFNILLASLIPSATSWQSFYIFQGMLLFFVSTGLYFSARRFTSLSITQRTFAVAIIFMSMFFADPEFIGPYPFPSSSVVRFFCVYALVIVVWFIPKFGLTQSIALSAVWSLAVIWSAESAIYGTAIFVFVLFALLLIRTNGHHPVLLARTYLFTATAFITIVLGTIYLIYTLKLGEPPDLLCFFEHALGYAEGYGYVPFPLNGPGNLLLLILIGISSLCVWTILRGDDAKKKMVAPLAASAGCIWGISTYYIGRPVPQNVTAILPIIAMATYFSIILFNRNNIALCTSLPIKAAALPLIFLVLIPLFCPKFYKKICQFRFLSTEISDKLPKANKGDKLQQLLASANPTADTPIVYYGNDAIPPIFSEKFAWLNETTWLPIPLQLLEPPISETRRSLYLNRYICRNHPNGGILIKRKGDTIDHRLNGFFNELSSFYEIETIINNHDFTLYRLFGISLQNCYPEGNVVK